MGVDIDQLLQQTSRTFALAIPLLPEPTRSSVGLSYLLFRVADTFEDATDWPRAKRMVALGALSRLLAGPSERWADEARALNDGWLESPPVSHAGYLALVRDFPGVLELVAAQPAATRAVMVKHTRRTAEGMATVVERADERGNLRLASLEDLTGYCYLVAGIVGELITELFLLDSPGLEAERATLEAHMVAFGEGLQLVNILKDAAADARDGRVYLPPSVPLAEVYALARTDLDRATRYVQALQRGHAPVGYLAFCGLSVMLAYASLDRLERAGAGAKVSRDDVARLFSSLQSELASGATLDLRRLAV